MRLILHQKVYSDIDKIMEYYEQTATPELADEFYAELRHSMAEALERPESFSIRERDIRRVNLQRFPYHFPLKTDAACDDAQRESELYRQRCEIGSHADEAA